ncbi:MAG: porin [Hyphomicrobiales bacterium]|nr:porin [Hyphomicrobiales bacterium]
MKKAMLAAFLGLAVWPAPFAQAGEVSSQNSMFLPSGKSQAEQALEAKKNARCVALYGPGYGAIADTDTCIRIGGRVGVTIQGSSVKHNRLIIAPSRGIGAPAPSLGGAPVAVIRGSRTGSATSADIDVDTHTPTEIGDFSTHVSVGAVRATGGLVGPDYAH